MSLIDPLPSFVSAAETAAFGMRPTPVPCAGFKAYPVSSRLCVGVRDHHRRWSPVAGKIQVHVVVAAGWRRPGLLISNRRRSIARQP
ncbi:hypothetical protein [Burkholderia sp. RS02]|uniref:hypothetical protein n=1 Tax=unclassified Burkholderia TaxID=2613784 RepID=UPI0032185D4C